MPLTRYYIKEKRAKWHKIGIKKAPYRGLIVSMRCCCVIPYEPTHISDTPSCYAFLNIPTGGGQSRIVCGLG